MASASRRGRHESSPHSPSANQYAPALPDTTNSYPKEKRSHRPKSVEPGSTLQPKRSSIKSLSPRSHGWESDRNSSPSIPNHDRPPTPQVPPFIHTGASNDATSTGRYGDDDGSYSPRPNTRDRSASSPITTSIYRATSPQPPASSRPADNSRSRSKARVEYDVPLSPLPGPRDPTTRDAGAITSRKKHGQKLALNEVNQDRLRQSSRSPIQGYGSPALGSSIVTPVPSPKVPCVPTRMRSSTMASRSTPVTSPNPQTGSPREYDILSQAQMRGPFRVVNGSIHEESSDAGESETKPKLTDSGTGSTSGDRQFSSQRVKSPLLSDRSASPTLTSTYDFVRASESSTYTQASRLQMRSPIPDDNASESTIRVSKASSRHNKDSHRRAPSRSLPDTPKLSSESSGPLAQDLHPKKLRSLLKGQSGRSSPLVPNYHSSSDDVPPPPKPLPRPRQSSDMPSPFPYEDPSKIPGLDKSSRGGSRASSPAPPSPRPSEMSHPTKKNALEGIMDVLGLGIGIDSGSQSTPRPRKGKTRPTLELNGMNGSQWSLEATYDSNSASDSPYERPVPPAPPPAQASFETNNSDPSRTGTYTTARSVFSSESDRFHAVADWHHQDGSEDDHACVLEPDEDFPGMTAATSLNRISASMDQRYEEHTQFSISLHAAKSQASKDALFDALHQTRMDMSYPPSPHCLENGNSYYGNDGDMSPGRPTLVYSGNNTGQSRQRSRSPHQPHIVIQPSTSMSSGGFQRNSFASSSQYSNHDNEPDNGDHNAGQSRWSQASSIQESVEEGWSSGAQKLIDAVSNGPSTEFTGSQRSASPPPPDGSRSRSRSPARTEDMSTPTSMAPSVHVTSKTWKSALPADAQRSLLEKYGSYEMRRQEVIWELCNTEQAFVQSIRTVIRLFVQPLRTKDGKWIPGIPNDVTNLFDWLDDIVQLHSHISVALLDIRSSQWPVVLEVAETLRAFMPHLELHQPYLVRLEHVSQSLDELARDMQSDLGEFIRIQTASPECGNMSLTSFLLKPVQRLMKYPLFFKQLWELTPRNHPDYLATFSLLHSTDIVIKVMQEVKAREDEYDLVKSLAERIKGLPPRFNLARRDRRLVAQGLLTRISPNEKEKGILEGGQSKRASESRLSSTAPASSNPAKSPNLSKFFSNGLHGHVPSSPLYRQDSLSSESSGSSSQPDGPSDSTSYQGGAMSPSPTDQSMRSDSYASSTSFDPDATIRPRPSLRSLRGGKRELQVYAFVFTDFVLLTTPLSDRNFLRSPGNGESKECWKVMDDVGISRVLGVANLSGRLNHDHLLSLDLLPMHPGHDLDANDLPSALPVYLTLPERMTSRMALAPSHILEEARDKWLDAFQKCSQYTLRALCFPMTGPKPATSPPLESHSSVLAILASGLPLPKSPSQFLSETKDTGSRNDTEQERVERTWWSAQFHRVLREMETGVGNLNLGDLNLEMAVQPRRQRVTEPKGSSGTSGPRPLLLGTKSATVGGSEERKRFMKSFSRKAR